MDRTVKIAIIVALVVSVAAVIILKNNTFLLTTSPADPNADDAGTTPKNGTRLSERLPRLLDLGADKCIPCKMMAPILDELKKEYAGRFQVDFVDVWKNPDLARRYGIWIIPCQIFFDASGTELYRHEGFMSKEDILAKWKELKIDITGAQKNEEAD
jgi:thioredoxin 1